MKKHLLLFVCAVIAFSAPAMAGTKLNVRVYNQPTDYKIYWRRTQCDCVYNCDRLPGGTIRPHDMWPPGDEYAAKVESKDSSTGMDYCASQPSLITLQFSTDPNYQSSGYVRLRKSSAIYGDKHWHKIEACSNAKDIEIFCNLNAGDDGDPDSIDIRLEPLSRSR